MYSKSLFIFDKDLRLSDNTALQEALKLSDAVMTIIIFDDAQMRLSPNYLNTNQQQFILESVEDLTLTLEKSGGYLYCYTGKTEIIIQKIIKQEKIEALFINKNYTPKSTNREKIIEKICSENNINFSLYHDSMLINPADTLTRTGTPYKKFTPFFKAASKIPVEQPVSLTLKNRLYGYVKKTHTHALETKTVYAPKITHKNPLIHVHGGSTKGKAILKNLYIYSDYKKTRDIPSLTTTNLSAHHAAGTLSIRQTYYAVVEQLGSHHSLISELYWRDFFYYIAYHAPYVFRHAYNVKYENISWNKNKKEFEAWCQGETGFPLVDAGMRQLNATGYMHNRVRMVVASFLTKDLHIDWRWGEHYFAEKLVDYDQCVNNGNWQWVASTGCDAQPYFRIFNPWLQQKKYDPQCLYIKKWVPELKKTPLNIIHSWFKPELDKKQQSDTKYPDPIVDHSQESIITKKLLKAA